MRCERKNITARKVIKKKVLKKNYALSFKSVPQAEQ